MPRSCIFASISFVFAFQNVSSALSATSIAVYASAGGLSPASANLLTGAVQQMVAWLRI